MYWNKKVKKKVHILSVNSGKYLLSVCYDNSWTNLEVFFLMVWQGFRYPIKASLIELLPMFMTWYFIFLTSGQAARSMELFISVCCIVIVVFFHLFWLDRNNTSQTFHISLTDSLLGDREPSWWCIPGETHIRLILAFCEQSDGRQSV